MANESPRTVSQETTESVTTNDKTNPRPSTGTFSSAINTAALTTAQGEVKQKINTKNNILMGLYLNPQGDYTKRGNAKKVQEISKARGFVCAKGERGCGVGFCYMTGGGGKGLPLSSIMNRERGGQNIAIKSVT